MKSVLLCCVAALGAGSLAVGARQSLPLVMPDWGPASSGLRMSISSATTANERAGQAAFFIAIENVGETDVVLNLGTMISNGKVMFPEAVRLLLRDSQGRTRELQYFDRRYPGIAGRIDDFTVALRAGSVHAIRVSLDDYCSVGTKEFVLKLVPGQYRMQARFDGHGARSLNGDTLGIALLNFWKGVLQSNTDVFDIR